MAYWTNLLTSNPGVKSEILAGFSESTENKINLAGVVANGIQYQEYA